MVSNSLWLHELRTEGILGVLERTHTESSQQCTISSLFSEHKPHTAVKVAGAGHFLWAAFLEPPKTLTFFLPSLPVPLSWLACDPLVSYGWPPGCVWDSSWVCLRGSLPPWLSTAPCRQPLLTQRELLPGLFICQEHERGLWSSGSRGSQNPTPCPSIHHITCKSKLHFTWLIAVNSALIWQK